MQQTFDDLYMERKRQSGQGVFGFVLWLFLETGIGILREHLMLISPGDTMKSIFKTFGVSALGSLLLVLPLMVMEVVNRRIFNEGFPFGLFFVLWLNLFAVIFILLPIASVRRVGDPGVADSLSPQGNKLLTNPKSTLAISFALILFILLLAWLSSTGWAPLVRLFNGPDPEQPYVFGQILTVVMVSIPIAAGVIASRPIISTLRAGGRLFAHPVHLVIVGGLVFFFAAGVVGLIVDQWPCFIGVPVCD